MVFGDVHEALEAQVRLREASSVDAAQVGDVALREARFECGLVLF